MILCRHSARLNFMVFLFSCWHTCMHMAPIRRCFCEVFVFMLVLVIIYQFYLKSPENKEKKFVILSEADALQGLKSACSTHVKVESSRSKKSNKPRKPCAIRMDTLNKFCEVNRDIVPEIYNNMAERLNITPGGKWSPPDCDAWQKVAIIVPYRDRKLHLLLFLQHMHPFLQAQKVDYTIVVVEQTSALRFNRGKLLNIGFAEIAQDESFCCFIFHDVDLLPQSPRNIYGCGEQPRHMCPAVNTFRYVLPYYQLFGGVVAFTRSQFRFVNGYSNNYFGWGAEDDDLSNRVQFYNMQVHRWPENISWYTMLSHRKATPNIFRHALLANSFERITKDGLNSLNYKVVNKTITALYTHILVNL